MNITGISPHAEFYPLLSDEALQELAADIAENGQRQPIMVTPAGVLLDGRNRLKACELAGVEPQFAVYEGDDEGAFVRSSNERRHQSTGSRAMSTALSLQADGLRNNGRWKYGALDSRDPANSNTWLAALRQAGLVLDELPELAEFVVDGTIALDDAYKQARTKRQQRLDAEEAKQQAIRDEQKREDHAGRFFDNHPEAQAWLDAKPQGTFTTMREAYAAYMEYDREARAKEAAERKAKEQAEREIRDRLERHARYVEAFVTNFQIGLDMATNPEREEILNTCTPDIRTRFREIESTYLKGQD